MLRQEHVVTIYNRKVCSMFRNLEDFTLDKSYKCRPNRRFGTCSVQRPNSHGNVCCLCMYDLVVAFFGVLEDETVF